MNFRLGLEILRNISVSELAIFEVLLKYRDLFLYEQVVTSVARKATIVMRIVSCCHLLKLRLTPHRNDPTRAYSSQKRPNIVSNKDIASD